MDAKAICAMARDRGALSFVDDYHGIGIVPLDLHDLGCDLYTAGHAQVAVRRAGHGVPLRAARRCCRRCEPAVTGWFATRGAVLVRQPAPRATTRPRGGSSTARRRRRSFFIAQGGLDIIREVTPGADPRAPGRADRARHRPRGRGGAPGADAARPRGARRRRERGGRARTPGRSATHCWNATSARTSAATACASARTSSTTRPTSTGASRSSVRSSSPARTSERRRGRAAPGCSTGRDGSTAGSWVGRYRRRRSRGPPARAHPARRSMHRSSRATRSAPTRLRQRASDHEVPPSTLTSTRVDAAPGRTRRGPPASPARRRASARA